MHSAIRYYLVAIMCGLEVELSEILEVGNMIVFELLLGFTVGLLLIGVSVVELNAEVKRDVALGCGCYV